MTSGRGTTNGEPSSFSVAVNLTWCTPGRVGGSEQYLVRQLAGLGSQTSDADGAPPQVTVHLSAALGAAQPSLGVHRCAVTRWPVERRAARIIYEHGPLAWATRHADVVHHGGGTAPLWGPQPRVVTVHDLQYLHHPEYFSSTRRRYLHAMMPQSVRRAAVVCVPTAHVAAEVCAEFGIDRDRVHVVPHGVAAPSVDAAQIDEIRTRVGAHTRPMLVYPAITHPHKGHLLLLTALSQLDDDVVVVLCGGEGPAEADVRAAIDRGGFGDRVVRTGRVSDADRDALIAGADALVFPSEHEGFGAPLIEAMSMGTPAVVADIPALREVSANGTAARVVPADPAAWANAIGDVLSTPDPWITAGRDRARAYTLAASGRALLSAYRAAVGHHAPDGVPR